MKLSVIVCGAAAGLAVAPYLVKQVLPAESAAQSATLPVSDPVTVVEAKIDLPVAAPKADAVAKPVATPLTLTNPIKEETIAQPELRLAAPALPTPSAITAQSVASLPSLSNTVIASAPPTPASTPVPTPAPTPEIPYRSDVESAQKLMRELSLSTGKIDGKLGPNTKAALVEYQKKEGLAADGEVTPEVLSRLEKSVAALPTPTPEPEKKVVVTDSESKKSDANADDMAISSADDPDTLIVRKGADSSSDKPSESSMDIEQKEVAASSAPKRNLNPGPVPTLQNQVNVKKLQVELKEAGVYDGDVDGKWGDLTRTAMRAYQEKMDLEVTGKPNKETWLSMNNDSAEFEPKAVKVAEGKKETKSESKDKTDAEELSSKVADADLEEVDSEKVVVTVNGDGVSSPNAKKPLPTPKAVTTIIKKTDTEESDAVDTKKDSGEMSDLAVAKEDKESQAAELKKQITATKARIETVSNDSTFEVKKYAPKMLDTVNNMAADLNGNSAVDDPDDTKDRLKRIMEELEKAKTESMKNKAEDLVGGVRESYNSLKKNFPERIKSLSLSDKEEKKQREEITVFVASIDKGFDAMESDMKKGKYEPIFKNGTEFKNTIDEVNDGLAKLYVQGKLDDEKVKDKLDKKKISEIETLVEKEDHVKAAELLDKSISSSSKKKS